MHMNVMNAMNMAPDAMYAGGRSRVELVWLINESGGSSGGLGGEGDATAGGKAAMRRRASLRPALGAEGWRSAFRGDGLACAPRFLEDGREYCSEPEVAAQVLL